MDLFRKYVKTNYSLIIPVILLLTNQSYRNFRYYCIVSWNYL